MSKWLSISAISGLEMALKNSGDIVFKKVLLSRPRCCEAICFPDSELGRVIKIAGLSYPSSIKEEETNLKNIFFLDIAPYDAASDDCLCSPTYLEIARGIAKEYGLKICLHNNTRYNEGVRNDGWVHVYPYTSPVVKCGYFTTERLFGRDIKLNGIRPDRFPDFPLKDADGLLFGEMRGRGKRNLYLYCFVDLCDYDALTEEILIRAFSAYLSSTQGAVIEPEEIAKQISLERESQTREKYMLACSSRIRQEIVEVESKLLENDLSISQLSEQLADAYRQRDFMLKRRGILNANRSTVLEEYGKEYDQLRSNPNIQDFRLIDHEHRIVIVTEKLVLEKRVIGRMEITMHLKNGEFEIKNLDNVIDFTHHHPHVSDTDCCLGGANDAIKERILEAQFALAFQIIWRRLNIYTLGEEYEDIDSWPEEA